MKDLNLLLRKNIQDLEPYSCARNEYSGKGTKVFLDANENPYNSPINRYPDPLQKDIKEKISRLKRVHPECIFLGNGSDEAIDLVYRCFCEPRIDNVVAIEPTYGMYKVCADINDVEYRKVLLDENFQLSANHILNSCDEHTKVVWLCSPNNPTGNELDRGEVEKILQEFEGIVVVDEAYSDFSHVQPLRLELHKHPNLIVLNTFSKAWGCAGLRLGMAFAYPEIIEAFNKVKYPYNVNILTQERIRQQLDNHWDVDKWVSILLMERENMVEAFKLLHSCKKVYPTDANFFLAKMENADVIYQYLKDNGIIVRNRSNVALCEDCLRITVGSKSENAELLSVLRKYDEQNDNK